MPERQLYLLSAVRLPTSYPLQLDADEVAAWLNGYTVLWHPAALAGAIGPPQVAVSYDHDRPRPHAVYCLPRGGHLFQPDDWRARAEQAPAYVFESTADREETLARLLDVLPRSAADEPLSNLPAEVVRPFWGLGFGYLLLDGLYEAADHQRLLDESAFWADVTAAVAAAASHDPAYRDHLRAAAEKLAYARQQIHSQNLYWVEFVRPDPTDLGAAWPQSLQAGRPVCVVGSGELFERLAEEHPERFAELRSKLAPDLPGAVELACGAYREREDALLPVESQLWNLRQARQVVRRLFGVEPAVYARTLSAFHPQLPGWLQHLGYKHALLIAPDGARLPTLRSTAVNWPGPDGRSVDAFCREPLPAHDLLTFFNLAYYLYQTFGQDAAPTLALLHTGRPACAPYHDLLALSDLAAVFGEFTTLGRYFTEATTGDYIGPQHADDFAADYLDDRVTRQKQPAVVSGFARHLRLRRRLDAAATLAGLYRAVTPHPTAEDDDLLAELAATETVLEMAGANLGPEAAEPLVGRLDALEAAWARKLAARLQTRAAEGQPGLLVFNPCNFTRRVALELTGWAGPIPLADPVKAVEFADGTARLVVEVPPLGFAWVPRGGTAPPPRPRLKLAEGLTVRNEFFECDVDSETGGIRSFRDLRTRHTRFALQLVYNPGSRMVARDVSVTHAGTALGEIVSSGELLDDHDEVLAGFRLRLRAWLGRPALELRLELDIRRPPIGYPWHGYYAARFGWRDERAVLFRGVNGANTQTGITRPVSPDYLEVRLGAERSFLFTGGLPFLQRHGDRMVDVILVPEGEQTRTFDLLLSTDKEVPMQTAIGWVSPVPVVETDKGPPHFGATGWLGHVDMPGLILTRLEPCPAGPGADRAVAARFVETTGFAGTAELRFARDPSRAWLIDGRDQPLQPLTLSGDAVLLDYSAGETVRVKLEWD